MSAKSLTLTVFIVATAIGTIGTTTAFIALRGNTLELWLALMRPMFTYYYLWVGIIFVLYRYVVKPLTSTGQLLATIIVHLCLLPLVMVAQAVITQGKEWQNWLFGDYAWGFNTLNAFIYLVALLSILLVKHYQLTQMQRINAVQLQARLDSTRNEALMLQINPHFLFNALNSVGALIETQKNTEAYRATELLGGLLRQVIDRGNRNLISLGEEIDSVRDYLAIEKIRFGDRFCFHSEVPRELTNASIPPFLLQPIVENAIKHAVSRASNTVNIWIRASTDGGKLEVQIEDDGPGLASKNSEQPGLGLTNVAERLELLFAGHGELTTLPRSDKGIRTIIKLPLHREPAIAKK